MNQERFAQIVEAYGAEPRRWPEAERAAAEAFVNAYPETAAPILAGARALDLALDLDAAPARMNDLLAARIVASAKRETAARGRPDWRPLAALAACAVFGLLVGFGAGGAAPRALAPVMAEGGAPQAPSVAGASATNDLAAEAAVAAAFHMIDLEDGDFSEQGG